MDDCLAARLAHAFTERFGTDALLYAERRHARALSASSILKSDLFLAVVTILRDDGGIFRRSRMVR